MKYIIMLTIVLSLAGADFLTGIIKAYVMHDLSSQKMRKGGLNKICEIVVMATACGLEIGINLLGRYYHTAELAEVAGTFTAGAVFTYIIIMELISILENYGEISPDASWVRKIMKKLRTFNKEDES
jgi:toxin secretion/phage lysis holin